MYKDRAFGGVISSLFEAGRRAGGGRTEP
jgi:hypothetical protein